MYDLVAVFRISRADGFSTDPAVYVSPTSLILVTNTVKCL